MLWLMLCLDLCAKRDITCYLGSSKSRHLHSKYAIFGHSIGLSIHNPSMSQYLKAMRDKFISKKNISFIMDNSNIYYI